MGYDSDHLHSSPTSWLASWIGETRKFTLMASPNKTRDTDHATSDDILERDSALEVRTTSDSDIFRGGRVNQRLKKPLEVRLARVGLCSQAQVKVDGPDGVYTTGERIGGVR
jgi:hypothetical protein